MTRSVNPFCILLLSLTQNIRAHMSVITLYSYQYPPFTIIYRSHERTPGVLLFTLFVQDKGAEEVVAGYEWDLCLLFRCVADVGSRAFPFALLVQVFPKDL